MQVHKTVFKETEDVYFQNCDPRSGWLIRKVPNSPDANLTVLTVPKASA